MSTHMYNGTMVDDETGAYAPGWGPNGPIVSADGKASLPIDPRTGQYILGTGQPGINPWSNFGNFSGTYDQASNQWLADPATWQQQYAANNEQKKAAMPKGDFMSTWGPALVGALGFGAIAGAGAGAAGAGAAEGAAGLSAADTLGLQQMGQAAGLSGSALDSFVASGGTLGSTAAGGGGIGFGAEGGGGGYDADPTADYGDTSRGGDLGNPGVDELGGGGASGFGAYDIPGSSLTNLQGGGGGSGSFDSLGGGLANSGGSGIYDWLKQISPNTYAQLLGSGIQGASSLLASNAQQAGAQNANNALLSMYSQNRADLAPWRTAGVNALGRLTDLTTPGKQFDTMQADPGYQFRLDQGQKALDNRLRAGGKFYSGTALKAGTDYNQGFASNEFGNVYNRLAGIAGTGQTATTATGQFGQNAAQGVAANETGMGNARASGYVGVGNAINGGISNYNNQNFQNSLLGILANNRGY